MRWAGQDEAFLDQPSAIRVGAMALGRYGGCMAAGGMKNEDAALLHADPAGLWEVAAVADGHAGTDSSALAVQLLDDVTLLSKLLARPVEEAFPRLHTHLITLLQGADTSQLTGETSILVVARKSRYVYWLSIGDCVAYVLHPELAAFGQFALNQRSFYEWFGKANSLKLQVPCFATGTHALRPGVSRLALVTDGLLEFGGRIYSNPVRLHAELAGGDIQARASQLMQSVHLGSGVDSATLIAWDVVAGPSDVYPSS